MHHGRLLAAALVLVGVASCRKSRPTTADGCDPSIKGPDGFCAALVTDAAGRARHIAVRSNGDIFVARVASRRDSGGFATIRGSNVAGFFSSPVHSLAMASDSTLYAATAHEVLRFRFKGDSIAPRRTVDTIIVGLPGGSVPSNTIVLDQDGNLLVGISATETSCGKRNPCPLLATSGGVWQLQGKLEEASTGYQRALALYVLAVCGGVC
jgi:glucose/arabinose dehydrogenase